MLKASAITVAVAALLATGVQAGEIKTHTWPVQFVFLEITSIPVVMDIGYYIRIKDQDKLKIKLVQDELDIHKFVGCVAMVVESNFNAVLSASITQTGAVIGDFTVSLDTSTANAGSTTVNVYAP